MLDLCTESDVQNLTGEESSTAMTAQIRAASSWIQFTMLDRDFEADDSLVDVVDGTGSPYLYVPRPPVRALTTVEVFDGVVSGASTWRALTAAEGYVFETEYTMTSSTDQQDRSLGIYQRDGIFVDRTHYYRVTYDGGLWTSPSDVADDLRKACALVVAFALNTKVKGGPEVLARTVVGETSSELITFSDRAAMEQVLEILDGWKIR